MSTEGQEGKVERPADPPQCKGQAHTHTHSHASWPRPCPCNPPWGGASSPAPLHHTQPPGAAPPLPPPCALHPLPLGQTLTSGRTLRYTFFSWVYHSCWGVLGFSGMSDFLAFWIRSG